MNVAARDGRRILIVEDDDLWTHSLANLNSVSTRFSIWHASNLADGMRRIVHEGPWDGAVLDMYLRDRALPFALDRLSTNAGLILAIALRERSPGARIVLNSLLSREKLACDRALLDNLIATDPGTTFVTKTDARATEMVLEFLETGKVDQSVWAALREVLVLEPNLWGLGIDVLKLIEQIQRSVARRRSDPPGAGRQPSVWR